jgi:hypothetical protein
VPEVDVEDLRRHHLGEAGLRLQLADQPHQRVVDDRPLGVEEGACRRRRVEAEEVELGAQAPVVARPRLLGLL